MAVTYWEWYGPAKGQRSVEHVVAYTHPVVNALASHASDIAFHAGALLDQRSRVRTEDSQVEVVNRHSGSYPFLDSYVVLTDPLGKGAAKGIEFGFDRTGKRKDGTIYTQSVEGKYVMTDALARALKGG